MFASQHGKIYTVAFLLANGANLYTEGEVRALTTLCHYLICYSHFEYTLYQ
jgi:hypothetical protein